MSVDISDKALNPDIPHLNFIISQNNAQENLRCFLVVIKHEVHKPVIHHAKAAYDLLDFTFLTCFFCLHYFNFLLNKKCPMYYFNNTQGILNDAATTVLQAGVQNLTVLYYQIIAIISRIV